MSNVLLEIYILKNLIKHGHPNYIETFYKDAEILKYLVHP